MNNFKLDDKIECINAGYENLTNGKVYTVTGGTQYWVLTISDRGTDQWFTPTRFKLYEEKEMFDMKSNPWFIRINSKSEFGAVQAWLKDNFGSAMDSAYASNMKYLTNTSCEGTVYEAYPMWGSGDPTETFRHEIKLSFVTKTSIGSVEYPEVKSPAQIELEALQEKISELQTQAEKLQSLMKNK